MGVRINTVAGGECAVVYARYSSHAQGEQSIEGQLEKAHAYAAAKGYRIIHEYIDRAQSGKSDNRAEFQRMLRDTAKKHFQVIILWKVDRFGRNREEIAINKYKCRKNGVRVEYVAEHIPDTPEGVILESVLEGFAEYYSLQLAQNVRRGLKVSAEKCQSTGGNRPLGYITGKDKRFEIDPKTAPTVKLIFDMYAGGSSMAEVIRELNARGLRTLRGKPFTKNSLDTILKNEKYTGVYIYEDVRIEGGMPRLIEPETFAKVQEMLKINKRAPAHTWSHSEYILTDKLFCGHCGSQMVGESGISHNGTKYSYYICARKKREKKCDKKAVRQDWIEGIVLREVEKIINDDSLLEIIAAKTYAYYRAELEDDEQLQQLQSQLTDVQKAIDNVVKAVEAGMFTPAIKARMEALEAQRVELTDAIAGAELSQSFELTEAQILYFLQQFRKMDLSKIEAQKRVIATFVNSVFVSDDGTITITFNYSSGTNTVKLCELPEAGKSSDAARSGPPQHAHTNPAADFYWFGRVFAITIKARRE